MRLYCKLCLAVFVQIVTGFASHSQVDSIRSARDTTYALSGDTLFSNKGYFVLKGQKLIVGQATGAYGWYSSIGFKNYFSFPVWFMRDAETKNNYDYEADPQKRVNDKVAQYLHAGDTLTIKKIKKDGIRRTGYWFVALLRSKGPGGLKFRCNIVKALGTRELIIP